MRHIWQQSYGKSRVRLTKVKRTTDVHEITELSVDVELDGDFEAAYADADNSLVLPTDTMKNTVYAFARELDPGDLEKFAWTLGCHFIESFPHVSTAVVRIEERPWKRATFNGKGHPHLFLGTSNERGSCEAVIVRGEDDDEPEGSFTAGIRGLALLKTTESGFSDFLKDEWTTLTETDDRILATTLEAAWSYNAMAEDWRATRQEIRETLIEEFGARFSPSVQATLYEMADAVLEAHPVVEQISLNMPNQHRLLVDLDALGLDNPNLLFQPVDEPFGNISASIERHDSSEDEA